MTSPPSVIPREGEIAFARSVSTLYDLTVGQLNWPVWLRKTNYADPMVPPLTLTNSVDGGACLNILDYTNDHVVTQFTNQGIYQTEIGGWIDFHYQVDPETEEPGAPPPPPAGSEMIRVYAAYDDVEATGKLYFLLPGTPEPLEIPLVDPSQPNARYAYWIGGG